MCHVGVCEISLSVCSEANGPGHQFRSTHTCGVTRVCQDAIVRGLGFVNTQVQNLSRSQVCGTITLLTVMANGRCVLCDIHIKRTQSCQRGHPTSMRGSSFLNSLRSIQACHLGSLTVRGPCCPESAWEAAANNQMLLNHTSQPTSMIPHTEGD